MAPQQLHRLFATAVCARDVDALMELYEPAAAVAVEPGCVVQSTSSLRLAVERFVADVVSIHVETIDVIAGPEVALLRSSWTAIGTSGATVSSQSAEVARRQPDGTWRYTVDNPWAA